MERATQIRKMRNVEQYRNFMEYPYECINDRDNKYLLEDIRKPILVETEEAEMGNFPHNIQEHYWIRSGENDGDSWIAAGRLISGAYFLYVGGCDYTGFDCQGSMSLWVSNSWDRILAHGMDDSMYNLYLEQTRDD